MNESKKQQLAGEASSNLQNPTTPKTWKKRWHIKSLLVVMLLIVLIAGAYLLRSVLFPNYLGVGIALCVVAFGLFLVRGAIRMLLEFDRLEEQALKENEAATSTSEANVVGQERDCSAYPPEI
jgi:divalent metal cation (Fe/Co/Zn/Cd) transporter